MKKREPKNKIIDQTLTTSSLIKVPIEKEVQESYLDYAMSVIVSRALPDVRDGLKPVQRRILYAMWRMGLRAGAKYRKSAAVVGETLAKFHPHGDLAVYAALSRMAQDFSLRYPLIDGQGNWGSIDGDPPAAQRYTECRLSKVAEEMLLDIEKEVVSFSPNYDGTQKEPQVLPAKLPNLLVNGCLGIAVGMATNIPPHNLKEISEALIYLVDHPKAEIEDLFQFFKGPDFPTGGLIFDQEQIKQVYAIGKGPITTRAKTEIKEKDSGGFQIIITELPYQVNKSDLLQSIANLVKEKKIEEIKGIKDESTQDGIRVIIDLKKNSSPQKVLNLLFKTTSLESKFYVNLVALVDGIKPKLLNLKSILDEYLKHRQEVVKKRTAFDLARTKERLHILEGIKIALAHINEIIKIIKNSKDKDEAKKVLMRRFRLSEIQANAILEMKLRELSGLERHKVEQEFEEKMKFKKFLEGVLASPKKVLLIVKDEVKDLAEKYADERRTTIVPGPVGEFREEDIVPDNPVLVAITERGYVKRFLPDLFRRQIRAGKGVIGFETKDEDVVTHLRLTTNHSDLLFFTNQGRVFKLKTYQIPETSRTGRGQPLSALLSLNEGEMVSTFLDFYPKENNEFLVLVTQQGFIKKIKTDFLSKIRQNGLVVARLEKGDSLKKACFLGQEDEIILVTALGQALRFKGKDCRAMGRMAKGVRGIRLKKGDEIVDLDVIKSQKSKVKSQNYLLVLTENGFGKFSDLEDYRLQHRAGLGIKTSRISEKTGRIKRAMILNWSNLPSFINGDLLIMTSFGQAIRFSLKEISVLSRSTQGVRMIRFKEANDKVASATVV